MDSENEKQETKTIDVDVTCSLKLTSIIFVVKHACVLRDVRIYTLDAPKIFKKCTIISFNPMPPVPSIPHRRQYNKRYVLNVFSELYF